MKAVALPIGKGTENMTTKTKTKRKTRTPYEALEQRVAVLEAAYEAIKDEQAAALARELDTIPVSTSAPAIPDPVIPLGYERCLLEEADRNAHSEVLLIWRNGKCWSAPFYCNDLSYDEDEIYLRCILPPEVASHWKPAPGVTHKEQRKDAWQMGGGPGYNRKFACWCPYTTEVVTCLVIEFERNLNWVPLVPKEKP